MNWNNLKKNKCPQCGKDTAIDAPYNYSPATEMFEHKCGFKIGVEKYRAIVNDRVSKKVEQNQTYNDE